MHQTITVTRRDVAQIAELTFPAYRGPQHAVTVCDSRTITASDLCPQGGTWSEYVALRLPQAGESTIGYRTAVACGALWVLHELTTVSPWSGDRWEGPIPDDVILVEHARFCGKDLGLRYYVSPTSRFLAGQKLLQAAPDLIRAERVVLEALCGLKSSYRAEAYARAGLTPNTLEEAILGLVGLGLAKRSKVGALSATVAGENARRAIAAEKRTVVEVY